MSPAQPSQEGRLSAMRAKIAALEAGTRTPTQVLPFGNPVIDGCFPAGGLPLSTWHEVAGEGLEIETAAAAGAFAALLAKPLTTKGAVVWVMRRDDLHAPGLAGLGFPVERLILVKAKDETEALWALEDALGSSGVAAAVGEIEAVDLTAGRRLQLACERGGATGFVVRRRPFGGPPSARREAAGSAAASRWRVAPAPSGEEGCGLSGVLGPARWRVKLDRCRGGRSGQWLMEEADNGPHALRVVAAVADRDLAQTPAAIHRLAG
jgi:protein ImuA